MNRDPANPIVTRADIPEFVPALRDVSSVFNPGAIRHDGLDLLVLRVQTRGRETVLVPVAVAENGTLAFYDGVATIEGLGGHDEEVHHVYDPRLTRLGDAVYMVFAVDVTTKSGAGACRLGVARMRTPTSWELLAIDGSRDSRNGVLFPEKVGGNFVRLERPNTHQHAGGPTSGSVLHLATSDDLANWALGDPVMSGRWHFWDELIGSGPPPLRTDKGWLHVYHGVATHFASSNIYQAGVCLLDLDDPSKIVARGAMNILEPRETYELIGQVPNVVFPSGMIAEGDGRVRVYYGAADTCVGLAHTTVDELLEACFTGGV